MSVPDVAIVVHGRGPDAVELEIHPSDADLAWVLGALRSFQLGSAMAGIKFKLFVPKTAKALPPLPGIEVICR